MYALWDADDLLDPAFRQALADAGVVRLVVEVDDDAVADAQLRLSTYDEPVHALLSVRTDADPEQVTEAIRPHARQLAGWVVEERTPLPPPEARNGERVDALVNVALLRRPPSLGHDEWLDRWLGRHTSVAIETQATFGYVQNVVVRPLGEDQGTVDAIVEEFFPMAALTDFHAFYGSGGDDAELSRRMTRMLESVATFGAHENIDVVPTSRYEFTL